MPRVHHVKKARKDNPAVKAGESYYWWKFRFGGKVYSKTYPKRSQLTRSEFLGWLYDFEDTTYTEAQTYEDVQEIISELQEQQNELEYRLEAMPEHLQDTSDSGMLLRERIDGLEEWVDNIYDADDDSLTEEEIREILDAGNPGLG